MTTTSMPSADHPALPPAEPTRITWRGHLTGETANTIAAHLRNRFEGPGKRFTVITCDELYGYQPKVRTGQRLRDPIRVEVHDERDVFSVSIHWHDDYGTLFRLRSNLREGRWAQEGPIPGQPGRAVRAPYVSFEPSEDRQDLVRIEGISDTDQLHRTVIVAEESDDLVFGR